MLQKLVANALAYADTARVDVAKSDAVARVVVEDDGPGISEAVLARVLEPFERGDRSRSRSSGGAGLGLAISRSIARAHGGDLFLSNRSPRGLRVELHLPCVV